MNRAEVNRVDQCIRDFEAGKLGKLPPPTGKCLYKGDNMETTKQKWDREMVELKARQDSHRHFEYDKEVRKAELTNILNWLEDLDGNGLVVTDIDLVIARIEYLHEYHG